jgi:hypothetical protein
VVDEPGVRPVAASRSQDDRLAVDEHAGTAYSSKASTSYLLGPVSDVGAPSSSPPGDELVLLADWPGLRRLVPLDAQLLGEVVAQLRPGGAGTRRP